MADDLTPEIESMVRTWADYATTPFRGKPRNKQIENSLRMAILLAFEAVKGALPQVRGIRFGYKWNEKNEISVAVEPTDELTDDMLIITVGEAVKVEG
jgi:hypothetical protein